MTFASFLICTHKLKLKYNISIYRFNAKCETATHFICLVGFVMAAQQAVDELAQAADEVLDKIDKKPVLKQILIGAVSGL